MTLTTVNHDGTQHTAGGEPRHTQVEWINMLYRMQLCQPSTGINYRSPMEDFQLTERTFRHTRTTQGNSLHSVIIRNTTSSAPL